MSKKKDKKRKGKELAHTEPATQNQQPVMQQVEVNLEKLALRLGNCLEIVAQLDEEDASYFGQHFCQGFANLLRRGLLGATPAQVKTLQPKLEKMGNCLRDLAEVVEAYQNMPALHNGFPAPTTNKAQ